MSGTGKPVHVLRRSPVQQNGTSSQGGKVSKPPQSRGTKSSKIVLAPMNGELGRQESSGMRGRSSSFGKEEMNLMAARKADPSVTNILSTVAQVKLYRYDQDLVEWERTSTEGTLFIYSRSVGQTHGFMILNRLSNDNLIEEIPPNMTFRVQNPFVLFKKTPGNILGLCFQEESSCQETGDLLNSLGGQENHLPLNGHHSPQSRKNPSLSASMRSVSAPAFKQNTALNGKPPFLVDVLENRNYTSSEGENTSSPDSITSDPISFLVATTTAASSTSSTHRGKVKFGGTTRDPSSSGTISPKHQTKTGGKNSARTSSPRDVPHGSKGGRKTQQGQFSSGSVSPVKGRSRSPKQHQSGKKLQQQQNGGSVNLSSSVGGPGPRTRVGGGGGMRHAVSFDQGFVSPLRSYTAPQVNDYKNPPSSSAFEFLAAKVSGQPSLPAQPHQMDKTVRRLFSPDTSLTTAGGVAMSKGHLSESVPTSLHSIFSQVSSADSTSPLAPLVEQSQGVGGGVLPLKVISLEQVEKQMVEDVPSPPVSLNPLSLFSSTTAQSSSTHTLPPSFSQQLLLQPSAFMTGTHTPTVTSTQPVSSQSSHTTPALNQQGLPQFHTPGGGVNPNPTPAVSVEPPSPVISLAPLFANVSGTASPPTAVKAPQFPGKSAAPDQTFPAIPPLMHSPGMRAAPVSRQQQPSRGEPSSLVTTTASARVQTSSTTPTKKTVAGSKKSGKLSQQVSSTKETVTQVLPTTPPKYTSQSTPSLTPLAELSVPRRSTTAPAGVGGALMSPQQFAHSTTTGADSDQAVMAEEGSKVRRRGAEPVGLTREQLQQAMLYLIKHDDGFVTKLHEAYNLSLSENQI